MTARFLADTSALSRLHHDDIAARVGALFLAGDVASCSLVDLELLYSARTSREHAEIRADRAALPHVTIDDDVFERAIAVQGDLADAGTHRSVGIQRLVVAAAAEHAGLVVLHYDTGFDRIAAVTGQAAEWVVPAGTVP